LLAALINSHVFLNSTVTSKTQKLVSNLAHVNALKFTSRDELLVIGTNDGHLAVYDLNKETSVVVRDYHKSAVTSIDVTAVNNVISVSKDAKAKIFDIRTNKQTRTFDYLTSSAYTVKANTNNPFVFATGEQNGKVSIMDVRFDNPLFYERSHNSPVRALTWHPHKRDVLYSADFLSGDLISTNAVSHKQIDKVPVFSGASDLLFSKSTNELLVALNGASCSIDVRGANCLEKIAELRGHTKPVLDLCQLGKNNVISGSADQSLRFWDLETVCCSWEDKRSSEDRCQRVKTGSSLMLR